MAHENRLGLIDDPKEGAVQVVSDNDMYGTVRHLSEGGWALVAILQEQGVETVSMQKSDDRGYMNTVEEAHSVTHTKYVFRENPDSTLARLKEERDAASSTARTLEGDLEKANKKLEEADKVREQAIAETAEENGRLRRQLEDNIAELERLKEHHTEVQRKLAESEAERIAVEERLAKCGGAVDDFGLREDHTDLVQTAIATMKGNGETHAEE
jgi:hypothetical protein